MDSATRTSTGQKESSMKSKVDTVRRTTTQAASQAKGFLRDQIDRQTDSMGDRLSGTAGDLRTVADRLREGDQPTAASLTSTAADKVDQLAEYLKRIDGEQLMGDIEDYARRQPWIIAAAGFIAGFALSRVLKSSSRLRYRSRSDQYAPSGYGPDLYGRSGQPGSDVYGGT